jgi:hypothetical protein
MSLASEKLTQELARVFKLVDQLHHYIGLQKGGVVRGTIIDIDDPENRGRVRVLFDAMNPKDVPQIEGAGFYSDEREGVSSAHSHWIDASPSFVGKQPPGLVGKRVSIILTNGQYHYAVLQDVVYDPQNLTPKAAGDLKQPDNNSLQRLPIYLEKDMPPPCAENHGCMVVQDQGPQNASWLCVCLFRNGAYIWVRHCDFQHGHAGGNDITSQVDSAGNRPGPGQVAAIWDCTFHTSNDEMVKGACTNYGSAPRGNPWGLEAGWNPPPLSEKKPLPVVEGKTFDQAVALSFVRETGYINSSISSFSTSWQPQISAATTSVKGAVSFAQQAISKAQKVYATVQKGAQIAGQIIANPTGAVVSYASAAIESYAPQATKDVIATLQNPQALIKTVFSKLPKLPNPFA